MLKNRNSSAAVVITASGALNAQLLQCIRSGFVTAVCRFAEAALMGLRSGQRLRQRDEVSREREQQ